MQASIPYTIATGEKPVNETFGPNNIHRRSSGAEQSHEVEVRDGRPLSHTFNLDENGFTFVEHHSAVRDFFDPEQLKRVYYPEVSQLIKTVSGAARVHVFDH